MDPKPNLQEALFQENERTQASETWSVGKIGDLSLVRGGTLPGVEIAYETWGELNPDASNAVLICHALSGNSHAIGWWERMVGPGRAIDTNRYFVIGTNCLGGCHGSTGPTSIAADGKRYGRRFPMILVEDMVNAQAALLRQLGVDRLHLVAGGSMGGMQALEWASRGLTDRVWVTASALRHSAMQIAFNEVARQAILRDPKWQGGEYEPDDPPAAGLAIGRMVGHLSYLSEAAFELKFGREKRRGEFKYDLGHEFQVESYLSYQADKFVNRFDANSLLVLTRAIDYYECTGLANANADFLVTAFSSDWLYPPHQSVAIHEVARSGGNRARLEIIDLPFGHDAFLVDGEVQGRIVCEWLGSS